MLLQVELHLPDEVEERLRREGTDLNAEVKEAYLLELFRRGKLSHHELSQALGYDRFETDAFLKEHQILEGSPTMEDLEADRQTLERVLRNNAGAGRR